MGCWLPLIKMAMPYRDAPEADWVDCMSDYIQLLLPYVVCGKVPFLHSAPFNLRLQFYDVGGISHLL